MRKWLLVAPLLGALGCGGSLADETIEYAGQACGVIARLEPGDVEPLQAKDLERAKALCAQLALASGAE